MKKAKELFLYLARPGFVITLLLAALSAAALIFTFATEQTYSPIAYAAYVLSAYTLLCIALSLPAFIRHCKALLHSNPHIKRFITDVPFKTQVSLRASLLFNLCYAVFKLVTGILYSSVWFTGIAVYYITLCLMRFFLLHSLQKKDAKPLHEWRSYRICGVLLFVFSIALNGIVAQMIHSGKSYQYPGHLIYAMAAYAFYSVASSIINLIRYRRFNSPVLSATKILSLATALVAMLSLQTAMFNAFEGASRQMQLIMNSATGGGVCLTIFGAATYMVIHANIAIKAAQTNKEDVGNGPKRK